MGIFGKDGTEQDYLALERRVLALEQAVARLTAAQGAVPQVAVPQAGQAAVSFGLQAAVPGGVQDEAPWQAQARALKAHGKKIEAVKRVREGTGWGLKEAKDYVDGL